ncbi:MAG: hypothetical protein ACE1Y9_03505, partial [Acidimicrobiia bacterium]
MVPEINSISVLSITDNEIESYAASLVAGSNVAISGSVTVNTIENITEAFITGSALGLVVPALNGVSVQAIDGSKI